MAGGRLRLKIPSEGPLDVLKMRSGRKGGVAEDCETSCLGYGKGDVAAEMRKILGGIGL